jgi:hypothetical protein
MTVIFFARLAIAGLPAFVWAASTFANFYIALLAICNRPSPSPGIAIGSVAGLLALTIQPFPITGTVLTTVIVAALPEIAWISGAALARTLDLFRIPKHRFNS